VYGGQVSGPELFGHGPGIDLVGFEGGIGFGQIGWIDDQGLPTEVDELSGSGKATGSGFIGDGDEVMGIEALDIVFEFGRIRRHSLATANGQVGGEMDPPASFVHVKTNE